MPDNNETSKAASSSTVLKTVAGIALGAAVAFGAYFLGKQEGQEEAKQSYQERVNYAQNLSTKATDRASDKYEDSDEKISRDCVICTRTFKSIIDRGEEIHSTPCGHILCKSCIDSTLQLWAKCPICNEELLPNQTHRIFL